MQILKIHSSYSSVQDPLEEAITIWQLLDVILKDAQSPTFEH